CLRRGLHSVREIPRPILPGGILSCMSDFTHREVERFGKRIFRLGLAGSFGLDEAGCREALEHVQYVFWSPRMKALTPALRDALAVDRDRYIVSAGPLLGYFPGSVRRAAEGALRTLGIDQLDVFQLYWLGKMSAFTNAVQEEMVKLREEGKVHTLGVSIHDRPRAGKLAEDSVLDLLMIRYNAAHPGAEQDIFPHLALRRPVVVAYTATAWRRLLRSPRGWRGKVPTAGDCYRFCLSSPYVDVVLTGPRSTAELRENLAAMEKGPLSHQEMEEMRAFGSAVHG
ncbi:MAG: aldo/keto reductase, partial [Deltaproteobacteria bacterium]|nr:aldo/keto reductase [Deltaproteobacteria bacterium]